MRSALNDNPMVQMVVLAISVVILAFLLFTTVLKKEDPPASPTDPAAAAAADPAVAPPATADGAVAPATADAPVDAAPAPAAIDPGAADGLLASKGLPKEVLVAYAKGKAVAILVFDPKAQGSARYVKGTDRLSSNKVAVFPVEVNDVAEYSRITSGVAISRTPALIVVRPRKLNDSVPLASVSYGFRSPASAKQAITDAFYKGGNVPAYP